MAKGRKPKYVNETPEQRLERKRKYHREYAKKWRAANPEKYKAAVSRGREQRAAYQKKNREVYRENLRRWRAKKGDEWVRANAREQTRKWREAHPEHVANYQREYSRKYRQRHPHSRLRYNYGLTDEQARDVYARLKTGPCQICGITGQMYPDHNHATGKFRGLLCRHCNFGIGHFRDNTELLAAAIKYLDGS